MTSIISMISSIKTIMWLHRLLSQHGEDVQCIIYAFEHNLLFFVIDKRNYGSITTSRELLK